MPDSAAPETDAELYLRLAAERLLLDRAPHHPRNNPLLAPARILVAVGAVVPELAQGIVDDYGRALALRGRDRPHSVRARPRGRRSGPAVRSAPLARRIAFAGTDVEFPWGRVHVRHVVFADDGTRLALTATRVLSPFTSGPWSPSPTVTDDRGTNPGPMGFSGGGSDDEVAGYFGSDRPLAPETAWIEIDGKRVDLHDPPRGVDAVVRRIEGGPAERQLRHCLELVDWHHDTSDTVGAALDTLVGCGVVAADSDLVARTVAAAEALGRPVGRLSGLAAPAAVPEPWRSFAARRGFAGGPSGTVRIGGITPAFGGVAAAVCELTSRPDGFGIDIALAGHLGAPGPFRDEVAPLPPTFTATDDRGNLYLGGLQNWGSDGSRLDGTVEYWPGLDPRARALGITITAGDVQAVIRTPLHWEEPPS